LNQARKKEHAMLRLTIEDALKGTNDTTDHYLYLYRAGEMVLYIGRSTSPLERLLEHLGRGAYTRRTSPLGALILDHLPLSLTWLIELRTVAECEELVRHYRPECYEWYHEQINKHLAREASEVAEDALIEHFRPCLNIMGNRQGQELPEQYRRTSRPREERLS
jgi:hypothetical protein